MLDADYYNSLKVLEGKRAADSLIGPCEPTKKIKHSVNEYNNNRTNPLPTLTVDDLLHLPAHATKDHVAKFKVTELKTALRSLRKSQQGKEDVLVDRLYKLKASP